jgi:hypothetical protein
LVAPTIWTVSDLVRAHPHWTKRASDWFGAFDKIDLGQPLAFAKRNRGAAKPRAALATNRSRWTLVAVVLGPLAIPLIYLADAAYAVRKMINAPRPVDRYL